MTPCLNAASENLQSPLWPDSRYDRRHGETLKPWAWYLAGYAMVDKGVTPLYKPLVQPTVDDGVGAVHTGAGIDRDQGALQAAITGREARNPALAALRRSLL